VETAYKPFQDGIHFLAETFQKAINYPLANSKRSVDNRMHELSTTLLQFSEIFLLPFLKTSNKHLQKQLPINK
jgi:hypothetical protein